MKTPMLFLTAIITPILLCATLLLPSYGSIFGAVWLIYSPESGPHPMEGKFFDVFTVFDSYSNLYDYWSSNSGALGFMDYTLPIVGLPLFGCTLALFLTYMIARRLFNFFQESAAVH